MVIPKKVFRTATLEDLKDDAPSKSSKNKAEDGAPAGFPEGMVCSANAIADQDCLSLMVSQCSVLCACVTGNCMCGLLSNIKQQPCRV
jgi:hypothetical protein